MIISHWQPWFRQQYGGVLPESYVAADVETSGFSRTRDVIVEWGHCLVRDKKVVDRLNVVLNWYAVDSVPHNYITDQLNRVRRQMELDGRHWRITPEVMREEGIHPAKALNFVHDFLNETLVNQKLMLVVHNGLNFDCEMIRNAFEQDLQVKFEFDPNQVFDTGSVEKACLLHPHPRSIPLDGETLKAYFKRINGWRAPYGMRWNLDGHCVPKYKLAEKGLDPAKMHQAGEDAFALHLLMEEYRRLVALTPVPAVTVTAPVAVPPLPAGTKAPRPPIRQTQTVAAAAPGAIPRFRGQRNR